MAEAAEEELTEALSSVLLTGDAVDGLDEDLVHYIAGMLTTKVAEDPDTIVESVEEVLFPFLESVQCPDHLVQAAEEKVLEVLHASQPAAGSDDTAKGNTTRKLQQGVVSMSLQQQSEHEKDTARHLWGMEQGVKAMANDLIDAHKDKSSAKEKRRQRKLEAEKARKLLSSANDRDVDENENNGIVRMNVRTFAANQSIDKKRDVQVRNVTVSLDNGAVLLESGEIKFAYQRRYGLIGENGVGAF